MGRGILAGLDAGEDPPVLKRLKEVVPVVGPVAEHPVHGISSPPWRWT